MANDASSSKFKPKSESSSPPAYALEDSVANLLTALKTWQQAVKALVNSGRKRSAKEAAIAKASQAVLNQLQDPVLQAAINGLLQAAQGDLEAAITQLNQDLLKHREPLLARELETIRALSISQKQFYRLVEAYLKTRYRPSGLDVDALADLATVSAYFQQLQPELIDILRRLKTLPRKPKKARKREVGRGSLFAAMGLALLVANTLLDDHQTQTTSYILGGNALLKAIHDLIGDQMQENRTQPWV
ncbi:MAG: hypothetical protein HC929_12460 [Leptolyngbyaceae cyanobacterium SM2_5_2]|nr:hypothetical protein [Leptolyngbyaceae cyanobacterium SM2_5_2]